MVERFSTHGSALTYSSDVPATSNVQAGIDTDDLDQDEPDDVSRDPTWRPTRATRIVPRNARGNRASGLPAAIPDSGSSMPETYTPVPGHLLVYRSREEGKNALKAWAEDVGFKLGQSGSGGHLTAYMSCSLGFHYQPAPRCKFMLKIKEDSFGNWQVSTMNIAHNHRLARRQLQIQLQQQLQQQEQGEMSQQQQAHEQAPLHHRHALLPRVQLATDPAQRLIQLQQVQHEHEQEQEQEQEQASPQEQPYAHLQRQHTSALRVQQQPSAQEQQQLNRIKRPRSKSDHSQQAEDVGYSLTAVARPETQAPTSSIAADDQLQSAQQMGDFVTSRSFAGIDIDRVQEVASGLNLRELFDLSAQIKYLDKLIEQRLRGL